MQVFDLSKDLAETTDVAAQHPEVGKRLAEFMSTARTDSPDWPIGAKR